MSLTSSSYPNSFKLRIVFLGDMAVGKTSIIERYTSNRFNQTYNGTVGIDFNVKDLKKNGQIFRLQMWDTAGQERYYSLIPTYLKNANIVLFVFDVTQPATFQNLKRWHKLFLQHHQAAPGIVIGNKTDLKSTRKVTREEGEELARELRLSYHQVSAKTGKKIDDLFDDLVNLFLQEKKKEEQLIESSRQKMKQMDTPIQNPTGQNFGEKDKDKKTMNLKSRGIQWAKKMKCCAQ